jgi:hypothetical protein
MVGIKVEVIDLKTRMIAFSRSWCIPANAIKHEANLRAGPNPVHNCSEQVAVYVSSIFCHCRFE